MKRVGKCLFIMPEGMDYADLVRLLEETDKFDFVADGDHALLFEVKGTEIEDIFDAFFGKKEGKKENASSRSKV